MKKALLAALAAVSVTFAAPAVSQDSALKRGAMWQAARIDVADGQMQNYMDYLSSTWMANQDYAKAQGWLLDYHILQSVNPRDGEANIVLLTRFKDMPSAAEADRRDALINQRMKQDDHQAAAASGARNAMRKQMGSVLYREMVKR